MNKLFLILIAIVSIHCKAQDTEKFNLDFENQTDPKSLSEGWFVWGNYEVSIDTLAQSGLKAGKITSDKKGSSFGSIAYRIPANYKGESIKLEGYMKIENVVDGYAGLLLRIDGNGDILTFDNMERQNIKGTKDWEKYSITLDYPEGGETIYVAGLLSGKGEAWFDDFILTIDGNNVQTLKEVVSEPSKASLDREFDEGSFVEFPSLDDKTINNLELLGRVWGFLKYHHPEIAKGNYNWDFELFRFLPTYIGVESQDERDKLIIDWIDSLGELKACSRCKQGDEDAFLKSDLAWIDKQNKDLNSKLLYVYKNRSQGKQHYINIKGNVRNPDFTNENAYVNMPYPDEGFRLLSLYRYWNMINYFFPYRHLMDEDWNTQLSDYIPMFINAKNELEYELAALQLIGEVQDTHANLWGGGDKIADWKGSNYPAIHVRFIENKLVVTDYYKKELKQLTGLEIGDVITKINGESIQDLVKLKSKYYPASNLEAKLRGMSRDFLRSNFDKIEVEVISKNSEMQKHTLPLFSADSVGLYEWYKPSEKKSFKLLDNNIGYITLESIKSQDVQDIKKEFINTKGIIIDIRNYPSAFVPFSLGSYFVSSSTPFVKFTEGSVDRPGEFTFSKSLKIPGKRKTYQGKLVVLVNELTQSQAEYTTMAFRAGDNTTVLGSTTAGADGNVSRISLPGGLRTMISGIGVYYPDGEETQRVGIVPDIEVKPTIKGIREGRDELLEKAIELILND